VSFQREVAMNHASPDQLASPAPGQLDVLLQTEIEAIVADCLPRLEPEYRRVLRMRADGLTYSEIAGRLGVNENTVATWISRGIRDLGRWLRKRIAPGEVR
jgi:RNA polymerase sigma factor (sigma-70 family)